MSKFIRVGRGANELIINVDDIVNIQRNSNSSVSICYKSVNGLGESILEGISISMSEESYRRLVAELEAEQY